MDAKWPPKYSEDFLDYYVNWTARLTSGEVIQESVWTAETGITLSQDAILGSSTLVWIAGGTAGESYIVENQITTTAGRIMTIKVRLDVS